MYRSLTAWWGKEVAVSSLYGDFRANYHMLNWYSERALQSNSGSVVSLEVNPETQRFKRFFICFQASAYGFEVGCRPMLFLDGTHIKQHRVQGHIMQNFNDQCAGKYAAPFKKLLRKILQRIAYAVTEQEYQDAMMAMELNSADAKEWVL
ncbi:hypothetical protein Taro_016532 [Colocasia esculenta]|uniref:MULE transposase domain-containing protein n=1 Tax=Colocasia esculenta TaxID=4460 RepID=A0A843UNR9_COLES|nr:hypothetical protein [Colocasia esculenta]